MKTISLLEAERVAFELAKELMEYNEPIPPFENRFPNVMESCLATPFQKYAGKYVYNGLYGKASALFYLLIKNHPFQNGNKRIAVMILFYFLYKNNRWLEVDNQRLYNFSIWVAESPGELKDPVLDGIAKFIKKYIKVGR